MEIYKNKYDFLYDSYAGLNGYEFNGDYSYVIKFSREDSEDYTSRRSTNIYQNYYSPMINIFLAPIYGAEKKLTTQNKDYQNLFDNTNLIKHSNIAIRDMKMYDLCFFGVTFTDEESLPEIFNIEPKDIIEYNMKNNTLKDLTYKEYHVLKDHKVKVLCTYDGETLDKYTMAWYDVDNNIIDEETDRRVTEFDSYEEAKIWKQGPNELNEMPNSFQLALTNYDIFNKRSLVNAILYNNAISVLVIATDQEIDEITLGTNNILKVPDSVSKMPEYLEISSVNYDIVEDNIEKNKQYIYKMFSNSLMESNVQYTTALSTAIASKSYNQEVNFLYMNYKIIMNKIFNTVTDYYGISSSYNIEFEEIDVDVEQVQESVRTSLDI